MRPIFLVALFITSLSPTRSVSAFPSDNDPLNTRSSWDARDYLVFRGLGGDNETGVSLGVQQTLVINQTLYIAARDRVYAFDLNSIARGDMGAHKKLTWTTKATDMEKCAMRGKTRDECSNFIRVLLRRSEGTLLVCGTNAFNPICRIYKSDTLQQEGVDMKGQARCPFDSRQPHIGLFVDGDLYSATMADFLASDAIIYRSLGRSAVLRTVKYDSKWLKEPHFLQAIEHGNHVYFFFREIAVEYTALGRVHFSRVARVCRGDGGGSLRELDAYWTSYLKVRLNCSVPSDSVFYFDVLQAVTHLVHVHGRPAVIGVFSTQANSIPGSAVCGFYMEEIAQAFGGGFQEQRQGDTSWFPVPEDRVPNPRPGSCAGHGEAAEYRSSSHFPDETLSFIKSHPLLSGSVPSIGRTPWFTTIRGRYRLTQVQAHTHAGPQRNHTLLFLASSSGLLLKVHLRNPAGPGEPGLLLEEIDVYSTSRCRARGAEDGRRVVGLEMDSHRRAILVAFPGCVVRVPFSHCEGYSNCRRACLAAQDPDCGWVEPGVCTTLTYDLGSSYDQDLEFGASSSQETCEDAGLSQEQGHRAAGQDVTVQLLVISTACSFVLGCLVSGTLLSLYCVRALGKGRCSSKMAETSSPSSTNSLPALVKLSRLLELDGEAKEGKEDGLSSLPVLTGLLGGGEPKDPRGRGPPTPTPAGLPTPDATPELPMRRSVGLRSIKDFGEAKAGGLPGPSRRSPSGVIAHIPSAAVLPNNTHDRPPPSPTPRARQRDAGTEPDERKPPSLAPPGEELDSGATDTLQRHAQATGGHVRSKKAASASARPLGGQCQPLAEPPGWWPLPLPPSPEAMDLTASGPDLFLAPANSQAGTGQRVRRAGSIKPELPPKPLLPPSPEEPSRLT